MFSGTLDLYVANIPGNTIYLTEGGLGSGISALSAIGNGSRIRLGRNANRQTVTVRLREKSEMFTDLLEIGAPLAQQLRLKHQHRYAWSFDPDGRTLTLRPRPVNACLGPVAVNKRLGSGFVSIGCELLSRLGIPERKGMPIRIVFRSSRRTLRLYVPQNLLDRRLQLAPSACRSLGLVPGRLYRLRFDQRTGTLTIAPNPGTRPSETLGSARTPQEAEDPNGAVPGTPQDGLTDGANGV